MEGVGGVPNLHGQKAKSLCLYTLHLISKIAVSLFLSLAFIFKFFCPHISSSVLASGDGNLNQHMGNLNTIQAGKGRRSKYKRKLSLGSFNNRAHEGIKTVEADNLCEFSRNSDLCICIVTWNMNGQVSYEDLVELVGSNRRFDILVVGLQEVPRNNIARLLQDALVETHE
ncbi:hypothetical protein Golax_008245 [Gossypium laxum]|uniref:Inositol polyphosphate-related phosphatase domain-containing protein n=1 Tax=Gossypium laxum TaxID=34288 RepID=A0A7J9A9T4_9ROSI|nr:hypothetical protein [Gossypium laxum]